jgi:hypothetical protein
MLIACIYLALVAQTSCYPLKLFKSISARTNPDAPGWMWNWAWGSESTVSIVDRIPPLSFPSRPASFGAELEEPLLGYVIPVSSFTEPCRNMSTTISSNTGCPDLCLIDSNQPTETWIALVQRGSCDFAAKVREAQRLGAKAVVVGGQDPEISGFPDVLLTMYSTGDASDIHISSTYIRHSDYNTLSSLIESSNTSHSGLRTLSLLISTEYSAWEWYSPIITFIIILLLPSLLTFMTLLIHRIRANRQAQRDRAPEDVVKHLPWSVWTGTGWEKHGGDEDPHAELPPSGSVVTGDTESSSNSGEHSSIPISGMSSPVPPLIPPPTAWFEAQRECAICLCEFVKGDKVRVLPCHHIFHLDEVDEWLIQRKKLCPICKADVTQPRPTDGQPSTTEGIPPSQITPTETTPLLGDESV